MERVREFSVGNDSSGIRPSSAVQAPAAIDGTNDGALVRGMGLTSHARARLQQRGIPREALAALLDHGRVEHDHHGGRIFYFDKAAWRALERSLPHADARSIERHAGIFAVLASNGAIVTVGHRTRRLCHR